MQVRWPSVATVYAAGLMQGLVIVSFPASGAVLRGMHGFSDAQYGAIFLPQTAMAIVGSLLAGGLARRLGLPALARLAVAASAVAELLLASTTQVGPGLAYVALLLAIGLAGLGFGLASAPLNASPGILFPARRETALVVMHTLIGAGFAVGPLLEGAAAMHDTWVAFPLTLAVLAATLVFGPYPRGEEAPVEAARVEGKPTGSFQFWTLTGVAIVYALCEGTFASWVTIFLQEERGVAAPSAALALSMFWAALVAGRLLVSALVLRVPSRLIWAALPLLMAAAFWLLPGAHDATSGIAAFALAGLACSAFFPLTVGIASDLFRDHVAFVGSMLTASLMFGVGVGSFLLGALRKVAGLSDLYRWSSVYAAVLLALVFVLSQRRPKPVGATR
jgi:predicted MFS family arabinose efflux permease